MIVYCSILLILFVWILYFFPTQSQKSRSEFVTYFTPGVQWPYISHRDQQLTIITFARNTAEFEWITTQFTKLNPSRPNVICVVCNSNFQTIDGLSRNIKIVMSDDCSLYKMMHMGLIHVTTDLFMFLEPGFILSDGFLEHLGSSFNNHNIQVQNVTGADMYVVTGLEYVTDERPNHDIIKNIKSSKLRPFMANRHINLYAWKTKWSMFPKWIQKSQHPELIYYEIQNLDELPRIWWFLLPTEQWRKRISEMLFQLHEQYSYELVTHSVELRERLIEKIKTVPHLKYYYLTKHAVIHVTTPLLRGITLAVHLSPDRLPALRKTLNRWDGSVSIAFGVNDARECTQVMDLIKEYSPKQKGLFKAKCLVNPYPPTQKDKEVIQGYHTGIRHTVGTSYPVNILRNIAMYITETDMVLLIDADFCPDR